MMSVILHMLVGLGVFLYGMSQLETGIHAVSDARLRMWLARHTRTPLTSISSGALVTAILQSSSMVSLLVLAFASAGVMPLYNSIGVVIGANLGTTITGWLVATLGFKLDLASLALPMVGLGGLIAVLMNKGHRLHSWSQMILGLGLLLFGLSLMKDSVGELAQTWDIAQLQGLNPVVYLAAGVAAAALVQSSSAVVMLTLAALHADIVDLAEAAALVIGADLGTTSTTLLGSIGGAAIKRQLALAHVIFNLVVDIAAFILLLPLLPGVVAWLGLNDPLYTLVGFHTLINLLGVLAFFPALKPFSQWLSRLFAAPAGNFPLLATIPAQVPEIALQAIATALNRQWLVAAVNNLRNFLLVPNQLDLPLRQKTALLQAIGDIDAGNGTREIYEQIKHQEVEVLQLSFRLQQQALDETQAANLIRLTEMSRAVVYTSKTLRDIAGDLKDIAQAVRQNESSALSWINSAQRQFARQLYRTLVLLFVEFHDNAYVQEQLTALKLSNDQHYKAMNDGVLQRGQNLDSEPVSLSTLLNVNREIHHATRSLIKSVELWQELAPLRNSMRNNTSTSKNPQGAVAI